MAPTRGGVSGVAAVTSHVLEVLLAAILKSGGMRTNWNILDYCDFWKILRQPGLKCEPAIFTVYSGFSYCLKGTSKITTRSFWPIMKTRVNCINC